MNESRGDEPASSTGQTEGVALTLQLGDWRVDVLECGRLSLDGGAMFGSVPRVIWERRIEPDSRHRIPLAMRLLLLRHATSGETVLVDTGVGNFFDESFRDQFDVRDPRDEDAAAPRHPVATALACAGLEPDDVSRLILTHLHFDHAGGVVARTPSGLRTTLPGAIHHLQRANLTNAERPNPRERASYLDELREGIPSQRLELVDGEAELLPGLRVEVSNGHTTGLQTVRVEGGGRVARFVSDLAPTLHHVHLPFTMGYDICPLTILAEKERAWTLAAEEEALLIFQHDPVHVAARVRRDGHRFRAEPA